MEIEQFYIHGGPIRKACGCDVLAKGWIVRQPHATAKVAIGPLDQNFVRG